MRISDWSSDVCSSDLMPGNRIMMDDAERILVLPHMDAGKQPPGAADGVEGLAAHRAEPDEAGKLLIDEAPRRGKRDATGIGEAQRAERQRAVTAQLYLGERHKTHASAAETATPPRPPP